MSSIELVLLDFDGTLVDTAADIVRTTNLLLQSLNQPELPEAVIRGEIGYGVKNLMLETFPEHLRIQSHISQMERQFLEIYDREFLTSPTLYPGAREFLARWKGKAGILSNKRARYIRAILEKLELDAFPWTTIIGGDTFPQMKPHPHPFLEAMKISGTERANTVMVGDGHPDIEGAFAVGIRSVAVSFGYSPMQELVHLGATATINSFDELLPTLARFGLDRHGGEET